MNAFTFVWCHPNKRWCHNIQAITYKSLLWRRALQMKSVSAASPSQHHWQIMCSNGQSLQLIVAFESPNNGFCVKTFLPPSPHFTYIFYSCNIVVLLLCLFLCMCYVCFYFLHSLHLSWHSMWTAKKEFHCTGTLVFPHCDSSEIPHWFLTVYCHHMTINALNLWICVIPECDETRIVLHFRHIRHANKSACEYILKHNLQIVQNYYF